MSTFPAEEISQLRQVVESGRALFGGVFIDAEAFFVATGKLKKSLVGFSVTPIATSSGEPVHIHKLIDETEQFVENGKIHFFGRVWLEPAPLLAKIDLLESLLKQDESSSLNTTPFPTSTNSFGQNLPDKAGVENAKAEAERIIAEAKQEAERIVEQARRRVEEPWVMED